MFCVVYDIEIETTLETEFEESWFVLCQDIYQRHGSLGSRLHKMEKGKYFAYAQWPNKVAWEKMWATIDQLTHPSQGAYLKALISSTAVFQGEVTKDVLMRETYSS
jgi:hypothetical protein